MSNVNNNQEEDKIEIFCRYITRKGKRIYPKKGQFFHFWVDKKRTRKKKD